MKSFTYVIDNILNRKIILNIIDDLFNNIDFNSQDKYFIKTSLCFNDKYVYISAYKYPLTQKQKFLF